MTAPTESELMQTAAGTPGGDLLRRFWWPIAAEAQVTESSPLLPVRVLSEGLLLFRTMDGEVGLVHERCPHNGYPLADGWVTDRSLVCARHGWHFGVDGHCWVVGYKDHVYPIQWANARSYPVATYGGLLWTYLGPSPAPPMPRFELLDRGDARLQIAVYSSQACNWLDAATAGVSRGGELLTPAHTLGASLELRSPIDDDHTWCATIVAVPGAPEDGPDVTFVDGPDVSPAAGE